MVNLILRTSFYYQLINSLIIVILCFPSDQNLITLPGNLVATNQDGLLSSSSSPSSSSSSSSSSLLSLSSPLPTRNLTLTKSSISNRWFNVTSDLIGVKSSSKLRSQENYQQQQLTGDNNEAIKKLIRPFIKDLITLSSEPIESGKSDTINLNDNNSNNYTDQGYDNNKETDLDDQSPWDYRSSLSQRINDSAIVEDIFNRFKNPIQYLNSQSSNKQMKPATVESTATINVSNKNSDSREKLNNQPEIINDGTIYYDNNWFRNRQGNMEDSMMTRDTTISTPGIPKSEALVSLNSKEIKINNNNNPNRWYYTRNVYNAEPTKSGSTEAKIRSKETKEQFKSELTNGISSSTPTSIDQPSTILPNNYPIFDEQIMLTSPHHNYLPNPHQPNHHHLQHLQHLHHHLPYPPLTNYHYPRLPYHFQHPVRPNLFHHHHSIRRYPKLGPIAYSCCKLVYPNIHGKSLGSSLIPHGSSISKETLPASSTTPSETVLGLNHQHLHPHHHHHHQIETNCIPIYPATGYPFGYGPRFVKTLPFALKIFKKALLFG
ncbi:putative uncharacterized protein DDB_G0282129 isoform X2 [Panonychus citri]|uniref:putative uncharacterized protein DDB_G0282129 isoform X2 n=1 Tax=Panonychus citri TaxID=50023 RepID=UPI0023082023|nr:putative uncharacterized protein DDB_G0282129 isoform X2 [Panonychus citri]